MIERIWVWVLTDMLTLTRNSRAPLAWKLITTERPAPALEDWAGDPSGRQRKRREQHKKDLHVKRDKNERTLRYVPHTTGSLHVPGAASAAQRLTAQRQDFGPAPTGGALGRLVQDGRTRVSDY
ncbi:hypothetical protein EVAR_12828_1 [Eumeta japonica]|uniref:Uncharacterized protein n=1 Tax=Eumeta variegata TaxID=151549 RepID=A0A4C1UC64_EUMVA|nr:hypothetical protein EVAR_12828_1 [Eumeta japonica]